MMEVQKVLRVFDEGNRTIIILYYYAEHIQIILMVGVSSWWRMQDFSKGGSVAT